MLKDQIYKQGSAILVHFHSSLDLCSSQNHILEKTLRSSGVHSPSKKLYRDEMSRLADQERQLLRQENDRLQAEVRNVKGDLVQSKEKVSWGPQQTDERVKPAVISVFHFLTLSLIHKSCIFCPQVRQLDATIVSLKQHKQQSQSSLVKALEQENASLRQELEAQKELTKVQTAWI